MPRETFEQLMEHIQQRDESAENANFFSTQSAGKNTLDQKTSAISQMTRRLDGIVLRYNRKENQQEV